MGYSKDPPQSKRLSASVVNGLILDYLNKNDEVSADSVRQFLNQNGVSVSQPTLSLRLSGLVSSRDVEVIGAGRSTRYRRHPVAAWFKTPAHQRPSVPYDESRLEGYQPNITCWLSEESRAKMRAAQPPTHDVSSYASAVAEKLMIDLSYASSNLEGNTYNYVDTETLVRYGQAAEGKDRSETQMIVNHKDAVNYLVSAANSEDVFDERVIREIHALLGQNLIDDRELGAIRKRSVQIGGSSYRPLDIPQRLSEEFDALVHKAVQIIDPFEQSLFWLTAIAYLQPFVDINKRTGRLVCNIPLLKSGLAPLSFMSMDKKMYVKGLLEFYELGSTQAIATAFEDAYIKSAHRYESGVLKDPALAHMDRSYRKEISGAVQAWVRFVLSGESPTWDQIAKSSFADIQDEGIKQKLSQRAEELVAGMNDANRILYGVSLVDYNAFVSLSRSLKKSAPKP